MGTLKKAASNSNSRQRWDESFKDDIYEIPGKPARNRLFNDVTTVPMHWVEFFSVKRKEKSGYYDQCLNWDYENEKAIENGCPMCEHGIRASSYTYGYLINRSEQKKGNLQVRPVRLTPKCVSDILKLSDIAYSDGSPDGWDDEDALPDATDPKFGFDILISKSQNNNKTEYPVHSAENGKIPLSKEEIRAFKEYIEHVNFAKLAKASLAPKAEITAKLIQLGVIEGASGGGGGGSSKGQKAKEDYSKDDDVPADDGDDPVAPAAPKKPASGSNSGSKKPAPEKRASLMEDDDKPAKGAKPGKGDKRSLPWEETDGDGESETSYATPDEDDAPSEDDED